MANIIRWDPYREMMNFSRIMSRMMDDSLSDGMEQSFRWELPLDVVEKDDAYLVEAALPGVNADDLEITYNKNVLTIQAEVKQNEQKEQDRYLLRERRFGRFVRSITLPTAIDANAIEANYDGGILTLRLPKSEEVKPRRINVQSGKVIEAK